MRSDFLVANFGLGLGGKQTNLRVLETEGRGGVTFDAPPPSGVTLNTLSLVIEDVTFNFCSVSCQPFSGATTASALSSAFERAQDELVCRANRGHVADWP